MHIPKDIIEIIIQYYEGMVGEDLKVCFKQHIQIMKMQAELMFAHEHLTTHKLEFDDLPPTVIRNLGKIRGFHELQTYDERSNIYSIGMAHPRLDAIIYEILKGPIKIEIIRDAALSVCV